MPPIPAQVEPGLSMESIVVNETHASFYRNAIYAGSTALPRPVTDCAPSALLVGDATQVTIDQLTYFPRELSATELFELKSRPLAARTALCTARFVCRCH